MKKVKRRAFTEKQLEFLEQYNYLYKKFWRTDDFPRPSAAG